MGGINPIGKEVVKFHFLFKIGSSRHIKRLYLTLMWKSELLGAKNLKSSVNTIWSQKKNIWSSTAVDSLDFDFYPVKCETPESLPALTLKCRHASEHVR